VIQSAALADDTPAAEVFLLDMGDPVRIVDLAKRYVSMHGLTPALDGEPNAPGGASVRIVFTGSRPGERLHEELVGEGEPISPSTHPDIFIWELPSPEQEFMLSVLKRLSSCSRRDQPDAIAQLVRNLSRGMEQPVHA
jgi:FlaA1/EpsC-like NDP-sugar epimerase